MKIAIACDHAGLDLKNKSGKTVADLFTSEHSSAEWMNVRKLIEKCAEISAEGFDDLNSLLRSNLQDDIDTMEKKHRLALAGSNTIDNNSFFFKSSSSIINEVNYLLDSIRFLG